MDFEADTDTAQQTLSPATLNHQQDIANDTSLLRTSARVRAARERQEQQRQQEATESTSTSTRSLKGKAKAPAPQTRRPRRLNAPLTITEPLQDRKGKKRAAPSSDDDSSDQDEETRPPPRKRPRTSNPRYSFRALDIKKNNPPATMPKKTRKNPRASTSNAAGPSRDFVEDDIDMESLSDSQGDPVKEMEDQTLSSELAIESPEQSTSKDAQVADPDDPRPSTSNENDNPAPSGEPASEPVPSEEQPPAPEPPFTSIMGGDFQFGAYMASLGTRLKGLLNNLKPSADPTSRLLALQDLSEILSMSTEDNLNGYFSQDSFVKELVHIMGGPRKSGDQDEENDEEGSPNPDDEDAALAAALALSGGGLLPEENLEEQLLACRCLANLMEAMPGSAHTLVYHGAVPVLCSKLLQITFIDLAEQTISTLEKLSEEYPSAIVREGGLAALLNYLDFFSTHVQRTALQAAANCCRNMSSDSFNMVRDVFPTIKNVLTYSDARLVEYAAMCVIRTIESFCRNQTENLETLITDDLVVSINALLLPQSTGATPMISATTSTQFLRALSGAAKCSPAISMTLLRGGIGSTVYAFLTGVLPPNHPEATSDEYGGGESGQGVGSGVVDMAVMQNLAHRPKDQVEEALSLISELMPPLPKDGVFDPRGYTEKAISRALKAKTKDSKARTQAKQPTPAAVPVVKIEETVQDIGVADLPFLEGELPTPATDRSGEQDESATDKGTAPSVTEGGEKKPDVSLGEPSVLQEEPTTQASTSQEPAEGRLEESQTNGGNEELSAAFTNEAGEPLMAMILDDAGIPTIIGEIVQDATSSSQAPVETPPVPVPSSSNRHRHGEGSQSQARLQLLRANPEVISRFLRLIVPVLFDVYSASVTLPVRMRCFTGILKATSFVEGDAMEAFYRNVPVASFIGSILTSRDNPLIVTNSLQLIELLLIKSPSVFRSSLRKEGVLHEVSTISKIDLKIKAKPPPPPPVEGGEDNDTLAVPPPIPKKSSSVPLDPQDAYVLRSRLIKIKYLSGGSDAGGDAVFESLRAMIKQLSDSNATEEQISANLKEVAKLFGVSGPTISSFELMKSGLVDGLLEFATSSNRTVDIERRKELFLDAFSARSGYATPSSQTPLAVLVKRLQESLTRMESFEVATTSPGSMEDARRSSMSLISRTLRLKLVAETPSEVPKSCQSLMVSIHAIAPFSALEDYLKPRIAGILSFRPELTSGLLQALTSSGLPSSTMAQSVLGRLLSRSGSGTSGSLSTGPTAAINSLNNLLNALSGATSSSGPLSAPVIGGGSSAATSQPISIPGRNATTAASAPTTPTTTETAGDRTESRRRSLRLRGQPPAPSDDQGSAEGTTQEPTVASSAPSSSSSADPGARALASSLLHQLLVDDGDMDDMDDDEVGDDGEDIITERAFNLAFDGADNLTASTPHGTRIATPLAGTTPSVESPLAMMAANNSLRAAAGTPSKMSYAGAAAAAADKATDFYLEFRLNDEVVPTDMTVYGACHHYETQRSSDGQPNPHAVWNGNYTITFRKVPGKRPVPDPNSPNENMETDQVAGLPADSPPSKILRLLRVLHRLNSEGVEHVDAHVKIITIPDSAFINNKLTAKLARQLEEIMILASNCLPDWALDLPQQFGFLFPFSTRYLFLQSTSFGYARLLNRVISQYPREVANNSRRDGLEQYGRLQRRKVEVPRDSPMQVALKVFDLFGASSSILDVHFQGEVGTGLGPTLEFFASVCREFAWRDLKLWRDADSTLPGKYVHHPFGLFPAPMLNSVVEGPTATERDRRKIRLYRLLGQFVARALLDSRIIDISFNKVFLKMILGESVPLSVSTIKVVDPSLGQSLATLQQFVQRKKEIQADAKMNAKAKKEAITKVDVKGVTLEDMCLDFTVPGYDDLELKAGGKDISVTMENVDEYIELVIDAIIGRGARPAVDAFKAGFSTVFPVHDLCAFSADELVMMFGNADEDWSTETLHEAIKADHGFNVESAAIRDLIEIMAAYDKSGRRDFLQFITGSPKLPIGGFKALNPQLTVVRKPHEAPLTPDDYLPSVMTCAHYLKLPSYSSRAIMEKKLMIAMREGTGSFHLS